MKEELIRIEDGQFLYENESYQFDMSIAKGECIGIYVDEHLFSGTAYLGVFNGNSVLKSGRAFLHGDRVNCGECGRWIKQSCAILSKYRFTSKELTVHDYITALNPVGFGRRRRTILDKLHSDEAQDMMNRMGIHLHQNSRLTALSMPDYYKLALFKAWLAEMKIIVLDRITEILRRRDVDEFMECVQLLLGQGFGVFLLDMDEQFMYRYANRIDVVNNRRVCYRLHEDEFDGRMHRILGEERTGDSGTEQVAIEQGEVVFSADGLRFADMAPLTFRIKSGEIVFLRDENYKTASCIEQCFLGKLGWSEGTVVMDGKCCGQEELAAMVGEKIGFQVALPDRKGGVLFDNLTALDNLSIALIPKAGKHLMWSSLRENLLRESGDWFSREALLQPLSAWSLPKRLKLSYFKWYLMHPKLLICLFPFAGQEASHHEMIIQLLVRCAQRGMAVWVVSSDIDAICEKTENLEFLERLRYLRD